MSVRNWDERTNISYRTRESPPRYTVRQYRYPRESEERLSVFESDRSRHGSQSETRIIRRESNSPPRQPERDIRIERYERQSPPRARTRDDDYKLDRYTKTTEYFPPRPQPEEDYQVIRRSEVFDDDRQVVRREPSPPQQEEDYYYKRRVQKV